MVGDLCASVWVWGLSFEGGARVRGVACARSFVSGSPMFPRPRQSFDVIEKELLNGQRLQGTLTAKEVYEILVKTNVGPFP